MLDLEPIDALRAFLERGGDVLLVIGAVTLVMWTLVIERLWYFRVGHPKEILRVLGIWHARSERVSWYANQERRLLVSEVGGKLSESVSMIRTLIALCPMLGLLGTVTGMIEVFDVMAISGSGNTRAMASGVSKATIPTMAGMVAALSGMMLIHQIERFAQNQTTLMADRLTDGDQQED
jgi:biopolymer transport protein ExbB